MPADPQLPEGPPWPGTGHVSLFHATLHAIANRIYRLPAPTIHTAGFTINQAMQGEVRALDLAAPGVVTVPALDVSKGAVSIELVRLSVASFSLNFSGVTPLIPSGSSPTPRVQYSSVSLYWLTANTVLVGGDLA